MKLAGMLDMMDVPTLCAMRANIMAKTDELLDSGVDPESVEAQRHYDAYTIVMTELNSRNWKW